MHFSLCFISFMVIRGCFVKRFVKTKPASQLYLAGYIRDKLTSHEPEMYHRWLGFISLHFNSEWLNSKYNIFTSTMCWLLRLSVILFCFGCPRLSLHLFLFGCLFVFLFQFKDSYAQVRSSIKSAVFFFFFFFLKWKIPHWHFSGIYQYVKFITIAAW